MVWIQRKKIFMRTIVLLLFGLVSLGMYVEQKPSNRTQIISKSTDSQHIKSIQLTSERQEKLFLMAQLRAMHEFAPLVARLKGSEIAPNKEKHCLLRYVLLVSV